MLLDASCLNPETHFYPETYAHSSTATVHLSMECLLLWCKDDLEGRQMDLLNMIYDQKVDLLSEDHTCGTTRESRDKRTVALLTCRAFRVLTPQAKSAEPWSSHCTFIKHCQWHVMAAVRMMLATTKNHADMTINAVRPYLLLTYYHHCHCHYCIVIT